MNFNTIKIKVELIKDIIFEKDIETVHLDKSNEVYKDEVYKQLLTDLLYDWVNFSNKTRNKDEIHTLPNHFIVAREMVGKDYFRKEFERRKNVEELYTK